MTSEEILNLPMERNDADAATIRDYLKTLLSELWEREEMFSGKRPFGNSGWKYDLYGALVVGGAVSGTIIEDNGDRDIDCEDTDAADKLIAEAIKVLR
jgi:hypothetical protein